MRVSGAAIAAMTSVATHPAMKEPMAAMPRATPARPCLAIWWPSRQVTTEVASPGMLTRIDVVEPPYWAVVDAGQHDERAGRIDAERDRQQHGDGGDRPHARQHADQGADEAAQKAEQHVL